jgi:hypothetical protein
VGQSRSRAHGPFSPNPSYPPPPSPAGTSCPCRNTSSSRWRGALGPARVCPCGGRARRGRVGDEGRMPSGSAVPAPRGMWWRRAGVEAAGATQRPAPSEPTPTQPWRRVSNFHTRSLCRMDTVPSIRNVANPQVRPNAMLRLASTYRAEVGRSKCQQIRATAPARSGISPEASLRDEAFQPTRGVFAACCASAASVTSARLSARTTASRISRIGTWLREVAEESS